MTDIEKQGDAQDALKGTIHPFDPDAFDPLDADGVEDTTWGEVCHMCFCHSTTAWVGIIFKLFWVAFFLYFFILGLEILGDGAQVATGCAAGVLFGDDMNPVSGLMIGIICTVFLQSSSTTTSIIVTLVGAGAVSVNQGIYMVMGSNIGTSVTNTIVAMGQMGDGDQLERAFAGATVHDMFNFLTVGILFPLELISGYLNHLTNVIVKDASTSEGETRTSFIKKIIGPVAEALIIVNKQVTEDVAEGGSCDDFYPTVCEDPNNPTKDTCSTIGLIGCPKDGDSPCPALFEAGATYNDDLMAGLTAFCLGIIILFICLYGLVTVLQKMLLGGSTRVIYKATDINGYLAMIIGALITMAVQSSSITTSTLTPLVGMGLIRLEQMYPMTLGANIGTCVTSLLAAFVTEGTDALQVALAHLFFNITGIIIWYPIPFMRRIPLYMARQMGKATRLWKGFPIVYIITMFIAVPLCLIGISFLFGNNTALTAIGSVIVVVIVLVLGALIYWLNCKGGRWVIGNYLKKRQRTANTVDALPYDIVWTRRRIKELQEHTACRSAPTPTISSDADIRSIFVHVSDDMDHASNMVDALVKHTGFPTEDDTEKLGRTFHKEKEIMPEVDTSGWLTYQLCVLGSFMAVIGLIIWGIVKMFLNGSTGYASMGGLIAVMLSVFVIYRLYTFFAADGKAKSLESYKDKELKKMYKKDYVVTMAQIVADLDVLAAHTNLPALDAIHTTESGAVATYMEDSVSSEMNNEICDDEKQVDAAESVEAEA